MKLKIILLLVSVFLLSCKKEDDGDTKGLYDESGILLDQFGRQIILHGLNSGEKNPDVDPWMLESDIEREDKEFGFNFVRYLIIWEGIEPEKGQYDDSYIDRIEQRVNWYTSRGMYVMLDMHQDIYSSVFGGDGAPEWAVHTNGHPINVDNDLGAWFLKNLDPAVVAALGNFWNYTTYKELQDHYILAWKKVMERFKGNPYVIGYDLMNEPYGGDPIKAFGDFEKNTLSIFYDKLIKELRAVEPDKYFFFEPQSLYVNFGVTSTLPKVNDIRSVAHLAYAPHFYPFFVEALEGPYNAKAKKNTQECFKSRTSEMRRHECPMILGEIGLSPHVEGFGEYLDDVMNYLDSVQGGIAYWFNGKGGGWSPLNEDRTESPIMEHLVRTYPRAVAGNIQTFRFLPSDRSFTMTFTSRSGISQPTEIFMPKRYYPSGWNINIEGVSDYEYKFDENSNVLNFTTKEEGKVVKLMITSK